MQKGQKRLTMSKVNGLHYSLRNIPALMICYNRLAYTKQAFNALLSSDCTFIFLIDNGSTDGSKEWALEQASKRVMVSVNNTDNHSIANAMNYFLHVFPHVDYFIKVDNDTIIPSDFCSRMLPLMQYADIVQAKHHIIPATNPEGWEGFTRTMKKENGLYYNHFVGGTGIMVKRSVITKIPETEWKIGGWRAWQRRYPDVKKAFTEDVEIKLLDQDGYPEEYTDYYKQTGRI